MSVLLLIQFFFYHICIKQYLSRLCYMQISYEMVSSAHVCQLTVSLQAHYLVLQSNALIFHNHSPLSILTIA